MFSVRRDRYITGVFKASWGDSSESQFLQELFLTDRVRGGNNCFHAKSSVATYSITNKDDSSYTISNFPDIYLVDYYSFHALPNLRGAVTKGLSALNWDKLPSSSDFGLVQFFAELDDTLALFTKKFWQELSYGSFTWGVIPFVNDLKAVLETVKNISLGIQNLPYEDEVVLDILIDDINTSGQQLEVVSGSCKVRKTGYVDLSAFAGEAQLWLDRLGFHPDLETAWDLVPLSFVVDWVLPVGDFISSLHHRGWIRDVMFRGWYSWHFEGRHTLSILDAHASAKSGQTCRWTVEIYERWRSEGILSVSSYPQDDIALLKMPSLKELFNMFYIFVASKHTRL